MQSLDEEFFRELDELESKLKLALENTVIAAHVLTTTQPILSSIARLKSRRHKTITSLKALEIVLPEVSKEFCVTQHEVLGKCRILGIQDARHVAIKLVREFSGATSHEIGQLFGRYHGTVLNSLTRAKELETTDKRIRDKVNRIRNAISPKPTC